VRGVRSRLKGQGGSDHNKTVMAGGHADVVAETVQQSGQLLDYIKNHPIDWNLAIAWIVIVAVGCWLWAEFIEFLESRRMKRRFSTPQMAGTPPAGDDRLVASDR
jgi:hypothetical protein